MIIKRRAIDGIKAANHHRISISDLSSRILSGKTDQKSLMLLLDSESTEDKGAQFDRNNTTTHDNIQNELIECRNRSNSVWLYFPHLELVFLLFAFQGVVASQAQAIHDTDLTCLLVMVVAITVLVRCRTRDRGLISSCLLPFISSV